MKPKTLVLLAVAGGCGLVAMLGVQQAMQGNQQQVKIETQKVLVALENVDTGVRLTSENVKFAERPAASLPEDAVTSEEQWSQRAAKVPLMSGDIVRVSKLTAKGEYGRSVQIPKGWRVVAINVDDTHTNSGLLMPGDRVDVFVTYQGVNERGLPTTKTKTLLEYVEVFATDNHTQSKVDEKKDAGRAKNVSLLLSPEQVGFVLLAQRKGSLHLSWRNKGDDEIAQTKDIDERLMEELEGSVGLNDNIAMFDRELRHHQNFEEPDPVPPVQPAPAPVANVLQPAASVEAEPPVPTWKVEIYHGNESMSAEFEIRDGVATVVNGPVASGNAGSTIGASAPPPPSAQAGTNSSDRTAALNDQAMQEMLKILGGAKDPGAINSTLSPLVK